MTPETPAPSRMQAFGATMRDIAPAITALNNMVGDLLYTGYAVNAGAVSAPLMLLIACVRFPGSVILLSGNEGATRYAATHDSMLAQFVGTARGLAKRTVDKVGGVIPAAIKNRLPNTFTAAFTAYACVGAEVCREGVNKLLADPKLAADLYGVAHSFTHGHIAHAMSNPAIPGLFQAMAGASVTAGCSLYAISGLNAAKKRSKLHAGVTRTAATISIQTGVLNALNTYAAARSGQVVKTGLLGLLTVCNFVQIVVRRHLSSTNDDRPKMAPAKVPNGAVPT